MKTDHEKNHMDFFTFNDGSYEELKIIFIENKDRYEGYEVSIRLKDTNYLAIPNRTTFPLESFPPFP